MLGYEIKENSTIVKFNRKLSTGDPYDDDIYQGEIEMQWSYANS